MSENAIQFNDEEEKRIAYVKALRELKDSLGWKIVAHILEMNLKEADLKLRGEVEWLEDEDLDLIQSKRRDRAELLNLPDTLVKDLENKPESSLPALDPYPQPEKK